MSSGSHKKMIRTLILFAIAAATLFSADRSFAQSPRGSRLGAWYPTSRGDALARSFADQRPWHGNFYYLQTGQPTALVVPPTATMSMNYSWGVSQNTMMPNYHQFGRGASNGGGGGLFQATPYWPSHTDQFGVYPVRAPW
jgi:hypothetical protein